MIKATASILALFFCVHTAPAHAALVTRSFVSATGNDNNPCSRPQPCRTFQVAHDKTSAGGEINTLDPAGYGPIVITKSISIVNDGAGAAGILVPSGGRGIEINAAVTDVINLRGLIIEGAGVGQYGIMFFYGKSLTIENCVVRNLTETGIHLQPDFSTSIAITNTFVANNNHGISVIPTSSANADVVINRTESYKNKYNGFLINGTFGTGSVWASVTDSVAGNNFGSVGFYAVSDAGKAPINLMISRSMFASNGTGVYAGANSTIKVGQSTISGNAAGWGTSGTGSLWSFQDNYIEFNLNNETAPPSTPKK